MANTADYVWADVDILIGGVVVTHARGVSYKTAQEKEPVYGRGNKPMHISSGNIAYTGELKILQGGLEKMQEAAGAGVDLNDLPPFDIVVTYKPNRNTTVLVVDIIKFAEFTDVEKAINQNDKFMEVTLPFVALEIQKRA
jgi:hypothetical protein